MTTLKDYADEYQEIAKMLTQAEDDEGLEEALKNALGELKDDISRKVDSCVAIMRELDARAETCKAEARRLDARAKTAQSRADWLRSYLRDQVMRMNGRVETDYNTITLRKPQPVLRIDDPSQIPEIYNIEQAPKLDKAAIKRALLDGDYVPGCAIEDGRPGLVIR
jgi:DNA repair exonuclease SbcCD ATPase subunit